MSSSENYLSSHDDRPNVGRGPGCPDGVPKSTIVGECGQRLELVLGSASGIPVKRLRLRPGLQKHRIRSVENSGLSRVPCWQIARSIDCGVNCAEGGWNDDGGVGVEHLKLHRLNLEGVKLDCHGLKVIGVTNLWESDSKARRNGCS